MAQGRSTKTISMKWIRTRRLSIKKSLSYAGCKSWQGKGSRLHFHQQPEVNYLPRFSPQLIPLERYTLSVYRAGEIDLL
jgi:hypothetical protein